jgi:hypothetical protein
LAFSQRSSWGDAPGYDATGLRPKDNKTLPLLSWGVAPGYGEHGLRPNRRQALPLPKSRDGQAFSLIPREEKAVAGYYYPNVSLGESLT